MVQLLFSGLKEGQSIPDPTGHLSGLKASQLARLGRFYRRRIPVERVITPELARAVTELSHEMRRQIGFLINRRGVIESVIVGTDRQLVIPLLARSRSGPRLLRGVRFVHTHLKDQPLTKDDLTDLALLRLDLMVAIGLGEHGEPAQPDRGSDIALPRDQRRQQAHSYRGRGDSLEAHNTREYEPREIQGAGCDEGGS